MRTVLTLLALSLAGCVGPSKFSVNELEVMPPSLMVATKSPRTVYLVLDPAKLKPELPVLVGGEDRGGRLTDSQAFVTRDLKRALSNYFAEVKVVPPGPIAEASPYAVAEVKVDRVEVLLSGRRPLSGLGGMVEMRAGSAVMTWGFGLKLSEDTDDLYSFAGESGGSPGEEPGFVFRTMFEAGIIDLLKGYTDKKVHQAVLERGSVGPSAKPPASI